MGWVWVWGCVGEGWGVRVRVIDVWLGWSHNKLIDPAPYIRQSVTIGAIKISFFSILRVGLDPVMLKLGQVGSRKMDLCQWLLLFFCCWGIAVKMMQLLVIVIRLSKNNNYWNIVIDFFFQRSVVSLIVVFFIYIDLKWSSMLKIVTTSFKIRIYVERNRII